MSLVLLFLALLALALSVVALAKERSLGGASVFVLALWVLLAHWR